MLLRFSTAIPLVYTGLLTAASASPRTAEVIIAAAAFLLLIGLWTPFAAAFIAAAQLALAIAHPAERAMLLQYAAISAALAMLGPGGCSVDARLFGRKQISIPRR